jgi:predicted transcriptional regulator YdeE
MCYDYPTGGDTMEITVQTKPAFTVLGMVERGKNGPEFIPSLWGRFEQRFDEIKEMIISGESYGVMDNYDETTKEFDYLAGVKVEAGTPSPEGMSVWDIPEQAYAVMACTVPTTKKAYEYYRSEWLPQSEYTTGTGPEFELYPEDYREIETDTVYLYFPLKKR